MSTQLKSMHYFFEENSDVLEEIMKKKIISLLDEEKGDPSITS